MSEAILRCVTLATVQPERLPALLTAVTMRLCVDELRARTMLDRHAHRLFARPADEHADVLDRAEAQWLSAEVARLADSERAALTARMLGLTVEEMAESLGVSYRSAESALGRARRKMRALWTRTLGVLLPWRWRRRGAPLVSLAAVSSLVLLPAHHGLAQREQQTPSAVTAVRSAASLNSLLRAPRDPAAGVRGTLDPLVGPGRARRSPQAHAQTMRLTTRRVAAGPLAQDPVIVTVEVSSPLARIGRCARSGVEVRTGDPHVGIVCREGWLRTRVQTKALPALTRRQEPAWLCTADLVLRASRVRASLPE